jgi:phosphate transport system substrate-binding protein
VTGNWISVALQKGVPLKLSLIRSAALAAVLGSAASLSLAQDVTGAGASFPAPIYAKWADAYNKVSGARINYQSIGSGAGLKQIAAKTVDFGASDAPLTEEDLTKQGLIQFPTVIGGVVPVVNIKGIGPGQLKLTGQILGDIYLGKLTKWDDPAIKALNPAVALPDAAIAPVRRADGSGTSFNFTNYLSKVNAEWKAKVGEGTAVNWPTGAGGKGNEGVSAFVQRLPNSIGYVEYAYAKQNKMAYTLLQNQAGNFVAPDDASFKAAAANAEWNKTFYQVLTGQPGKDSWPITAATFIMMHKVQDKPVNATNSLKFFDWAYTSGDKMAVELDYVPMPDSVKTLIRKLWADNLKDAAGKTIAAN